MDFKKTELFQTLEEFKTDLNEQMAKVPESSVAELKTKAASISTQQRQGFPRFSNKIYSHEGYMVTRKRTNERCGGGVRSIMGMGITMYSAFMSGTTDPCIKMPMLPGNRKLGHDEQPPQMMAYATCANIKAGAEGPYGDIYTEDSTELGLTLFKNSDKCGMINQCTDETCAYYPIMKEPKCRPYGKNMNKGFGTTCSDKPDYYNQIQGNFKLGAILMKGYLDESQCMYDEDQAQIFMVAPAPNKCEKVWPEPGMPFGCRQGTDCYSKSGCDADTQDFKVGFWEDDKHCKGKPDNVHSMPFQEMAAEMMGYEHCKGSKEMGGMALRMSCIN